MISDSVAEICSGLFKGCTGLTSITIPDGVTEIGITVFSGCTGLTSITIPASVTEIGDSAFAGCDNIVINGYSGSYAETYANENELAFAAIDAVTADDYEWEENEDGGVTITGYTGNGGDVVIPSKMDGKPVTSIGDVAFFECTGLTDITIPDSVTSIGYSAFIECTGLTSVTIPDSVTEIGLGAFAYCTGLTEMNVDQNNESYTSEDGVLFDKNKTALLICPAGKEGAYTIPDSVTSINDGAFAYCKGLTDVTIPASVTEIGSVVFDGCDNVVIHGYSGSYAETYANENELTFAAIYADYEW